MPKKRIDTTKLFVAVVIVIAVAVFVVWPLVSGSAGQFILSALRINLTAVSRVPVQMADLTVSNIGLGNVSVMAAIRNQGNASAYNFTVNFWNVGLNRSIGNRIVPALGAGSVDTVSVPANLTQGNHTIRVTADYYNAVRESNENNNVMTRTLTKP